MSERIASIFEEVKEALKGKDPQKCESEFISKFETATVRSVEILVEEMPEEIKNLDGNDQKKISWVTENHQTEIADRLKEAGDWLEKYYYDNNPA